MSTETFATKLLNFMDKLSIFEQLCELLRPLLAPVISIAAFFVTLWNFWRSHTKAIDEKFTAIQIDVAKLTVKSDRIEKMDEKIDRINELVHEIRNQEHGVLNAALSEFHAMTEKVLQKFPEYDRKFLILFKQQKRNPK